MTFLPIVERELRIASRLSATYRNRTLAAGLVMAMAFVMEVYGVFAKSPSAAGIYLFKIASFMTMIFCAVEGLRKTADSLSGEKRDGTLGLLFLTDLKGYDVVIGKFVGASMNSIYGLLAILPVLALPLLVGGVTPGEYWRMVLALMNILFFSLCAGMLVSARCRQEGSALSGTFFLVLAFMLVPIFIPASFIACLSPARAYMDTFAAAYLLHGGEYWQTIVLTQALSWLMLGSASVMLPRWWQDAPTKKMSVTSSPAAEGQRNENGRRALLRGKMLSTNPAFWLAARQANASFYPWLLTAVAAIGGIICILMFSIIPLIIFFATINIIFKIRVAYQACHCFVEARQTNALEMVLVSPLTVKQIIQGQIIALHRILLGPVIYLILIEFLEFCFGLAVKGGHGAVDTGVAVLLVYFAQFGLDIMAVAWASMWFGLKSGKKSAAVTKTVLLVLVLPFACLAALSWLGVASFIGIPIFMMVWCPSRLEANFRELAVQRFEAPATGFGWLRLKGLQPMPPVISDPTR